MRTLDLVHRWHLFTVFHVKKLGMLVPLSIRALISFMGVLPLNLSTFPRLHLLKPSHLRVRISTYEFFGGIKLSDYSKVVYFYLINIY